MKNEVLSSPPTVELEMVQVYSIKTVNFNHLSRLTRLTHLQEGMLSEILDSKIVKILVLT